MKYFFLTTIILASIASQAATFGSPFESQEQHYYRLAVKCYDRGAEATRQILKEGVAVKELSAETLKSIQYDNGIDQLAVNARRANGNGFSCFNDIVGAELPVAADLLIENNKNDELKQFVLKKHNEILKRYEQLCQKEGKDCVAVY